MLPVFLDLSGRLALVVGGGAVGRRKATAVREAGGRVRLVCLEPAHEDFADLEWRQEPYTAAHLDGVALAFAAATPAVNAEVVEDSRRRGLWVNAAGGEGDFTLGSTLRRGELLLAVCTGGAAPLLARRIRERLAYEYDEAFAEWLRALDELRPEVLAIADEGRRREVLEQLTRWDWLARVRAGGDVRAAMRQVISPSAEPPGRPS